MSTPVLFEGARLDGVRVLVVEDDHDSREMLCELLALFGAECQTAKDVPSARAVLARFTPDVILSDIGLPGENGYDLLRWVHSRTPPLFPPPMIAVTASEEKTKAHAAGFVAHVQKPIAITKLLDAIASAIPKRALGESDAGSDDGD